MPVLGTDAYQSGRSSARDPSLDNVSIGADIDASGAVDATFEFGSVNNQQIFGVPKTAFIDNGSGPNPLTVTVSITGQKFTVPPFAQGYFPLNATDRSSVTITGDGGNTAPVNVVIHNDEKPATVWYAPGNNNPLSGTAIQGSMPEGSDIAIQGSNSPVYIGGIDRGTGLFHAVSVSALGEVNVAFTSPVVIDDSTPIDVAVTNQPDQQGGYTDRSIGNLSGASEPLMGANIARRSLVINNPNAANPIAVNLTGGAAALNAAGSITIKAGETVTIDNYPPTNAITVIGTAADDVTAYEG